MTYQQLIEDIKREFPAFKLFPKRESRLMRVIAFLLALLGNKMFMSQYVTTIGQTVYTNALWDSASDAFKFAILWHERVHMRQERRYGKLLYRFLYLFFPLPMFLAYFRAKFEKEAYTESIRVAFWRGGALLLTSPEHKKKICDQFLTGAYGWMWPFRKSIERWYSEAVRKIVIEETNGQRSSAPAAFDP